jgi:hypothetical protein
MVSTHVTPPSPTRPGYIRYKCNDCREVHWLRDDPIPWLAKVFWWRRIEFEQGRDWKAKALCRPVPQEPHRR